VPASPSALFAPPRLLVPPAPPQTWLDYFKAHRDWPMAPQAYSWTCSICASNWVLQATGISPDLSREQTAYDLGYPTCVNPSVGLADTQCMVNMFDRYGFDARREWLDFDRAYALCAETTGCLNSTRWYHFVAIRGVSGDRIWIANSALGYKNIYDTISRSQWDAWAGSWQCVWLVP